MDKLESSIYPFCNISKVSVVYFDTHGQIQWECCPNGKICSFFRLNQNHNSACRKALLSATRMAAQLGEPYIFLCPSGLVEIAFSVIVQGEIQGTLIAGPIAMGNNKEFIIRNLFRNITLSQDIYPKLTMFLNQMDIFTPKEVENLTSLFNSVVLSSTVTNEDYRKINDNYKEQTYVGERIQKLKKQHKQLDYPHELEDDLIAKVKKGDVKGAQSTLDDLLNEISLVESGNLSFIKIRVIGLCAVLARLSSNPNTAFQISSQEIENMDLLNRVESFKDLCNLTSKICKDFSTNVSVLLYPGNSSIVIEAAKFINENYMNKITLKTIAVEIHANSSYLSTLFKKEMGICFTDYLNDIRTKRTEYLLSSTNLSLADITQCSGFDSQSYLTKVFRKKNGLTPREYRKINLSLK